MFVIMVTVIANTARNGKKGEWFSSGHAIAFLASMVIYFYLIS